MAIELTFRVTKMSSDNTHGLDDQSYNSVTLQALDRDGRIVNLCKAQIWQNLPLGTLNLDGINDYIMDQFKFGGKYTLTISELEEGPVGSEKSEISGE